MTDLNFCPFCDAPQHKIMACKEGVFFCKDCNRFFRFEELMVKCSRCKGDLRKADFPSPSGGALFLCVKCKRTHLIDELLEQVD